MIKAKKSFGQNFLTDNNIILKIVDSIDVHKNDLIIEIGPGQGALTRELKKKKAKLLAFEIDERMKDVLTFLEDDNTNIVYRDVLEVDLEKFISNYDYDKLYVIANLPYYITTPIIEKLINSSVIIDQMTIMVQNEVADRLSAKPGTKNYGMMSVLLNYKYDVKKLFVVKNTCFNPVPKVNSAVINLKRKPDCITIENYDNFYKFVSTAFKYKRKTLKNNLGIIKYNEVLPFLSKLNYGDNVRAEEISTEDYAYISNNVKF